MNLLVTRDVWRMVAGTVHHGTHGGSGISSECGRNRRGQPPQVHQEGRLGWVSRSGLSKDLYSRGRSHAWISNEFFSSSTGTVITVTGSNKEEKKHTTANLSQQSPLLNILSPGIALCRLLIRYDTSLFYELKNNLDRFGHAEVAFVSTKSWTTDPTCSSKFFFHFRPMAQDCVYRILSYFLYWA